MKKFGVALFTFLVLLVGCSDRNDGGIDAEMVGDPCKNALECYKGVDHEILLGQVECLERVPGGYCTHTCESDSDCCAVPGECKTDLVQVCAPFESASGKYCLVTCEEKSLEEDFCKVNVHPAFNCRSTGGGAENRKVCMP